MWKRQTAAAIRPPAVAGLFYPADARELSDTIDVLVAGRDAAPADEQETPKALIAPHAGYIYSGELAGAAYRAIAPAADRIRRVVLLGPAHRVYVQGLAAPQAEFFETPLGRVRIDREALDRLRHLPQVTFDDAPHVPEHSLEVHLPFLQRLIGNFSLVPLVVGPASPREVAEVLDLLWGGPETLVIISSDLSHYLDYDSARTIDARTSAAIEALDGRAIEEEGACGRHPIRGLLDVARRRGLTARILGTCNSGDTAGDRLRVVGYGAYAFYDPSPDAGLINDETAAGGKPSPDDQAHLLGVAAGAIRGGLAGAGDDELSFAAAGGLAPHGASFVTLKVADRLRGCIGSLEPRRPLHEDVARNAWAAAFRDPRFPPLSSREFEGLWLGVSVLSEATSIAFSDQADLIETLQVGVDGLIIEGAGRRAVFLPDVWDTLRDPKVFLTHLRDKAGLPDNLAIDRAWRFHTHKFSGVVEAGEIVPSPVGG